MAEEYYDDGVIRVVVPDGWKLFCASDRERKSGMSKLHIYKNAQVASDIFTRAGITVCFFARDHIYLSPKRFYDNVEDIEPLLVGEREWSGYTCTSFGYPYLMLDSTEDGCVLQVMILLRNGEHQISIDDTDVEAILGSLSVVAD
ncbi:MAG: hypothetical protein IJE84_03310 [Clostridia bacterium]|nr:hypothetical protein [Clostridia bacterium]